MSLRVSVFGITGNQNQYVSRGLCFTAHFPQKNCPESELRQKRKLVMLTPAIQVWTIMARFPELFLGADNEGGLLGLGGGGPTGFLGCVLAWGCSEMIRYAFFVGQLLRGEPFGWIKWLRYNAFLVLYPVGLVSEAWLVYLSLMQRRADVGPVYRGYLFLGLLTYLPGK